MPRIAIDISGALNAPSGVSGYIQQLIGHLPRISDASQLALYAAYWRGWPEKIKNAGIPQGAGYPLILKRFPEKGLLRAEWQWGMRIQEPTLQKYGVRLFHGTSHILPRLKRTKGVVTVHHYEDSGDYFRTRWDAFYYRDVVQACARAADHLIAVSEFTKQLYIQRLGIAPERITVIYHGAPEVDVASLDRQAAKALVLSRWSLQGPYVLCVSHANKRKNITGLLRAFALFRMRSTSDIPLVIVGAADADYLREVRQLIVDLRLEQTVILTGPLDAMALQALYLNALVYVFPSLLEGFGLPLLEAMTYGCAILSSNSSCLPEIAGEAALLVSPTDPEEMAAGITRLCEDETLRRSLIAKGKERVARFTWQRAARETFEVYERVLGE